MPPKQEKLHQYDEEEASVGMSVFTKSATSYSGDESSSDLENGKQATGQIHNLVAAKEQRLITYSKVFLLVTLLAAVVLCTVATFLYVKNQEESAFQNEVSMRVFARDLQGSLTMPPPFSLSLLLFPIQSLV